MFKKGRTFDAYMMIMIASFITVLYAIFVSNADVKKFFMNDVRLVNSEFEIQNEDGEYIPIETQKVPVEADVINQTFKVRCQLEENYPEGYCYVFSSYQQEVRVYIDGKCVNSLINRDDAYINSPKSNYLFMNIKPEYFGLMMEVEYSSNAEYGVGTFREVYIGKSGDITGYIIKQSVMSIVCSIWLMGVGFFLIVLSFTPLIRKQGKGIAYIGTFAVLMALWSISQTGIEVLLTEDCLWARVMVYEILMLIAMPSMLYLREEYKGFVRGLFNGVFLLGFINFIVSNALQILGIMYISDTVAMSMVVMVLAVIVPSVAGVCKWIKDISTGEKQYTKFDILKLGTILLGATVTIDVGNYFAKWYTDMCRWSRIGIMLYITFIAAENLIKLYNMMFEGQKAQLLKEIAHQDILTKAHSRTAYAEVMDKMANNKSTFAKSAIVAFDVNDLKVMNDTYGHEAGDQYLRDCVRIITESFVGVGECYRTGGDEFIVIINEFTNKKLEGCIQLMKKAVVACQKENDKPMSMAYGYAIFDATLDSNIYDTAKRADALMYKAKNECKKKKLLAKQAPKQS